MIDFSMPEIRMIDFSNGWRVRQDVSQAIYKIEFHLPNFL
jgi:hypothetical protein